MKESKDVLRINKFPSKDIYEYAVSINQIGLQDLCLIQNDDEPYVKSILFDVDNNKFIYTTNDDKNHDIVNTSILKAAMDLSNVASSGNYNDLSNIPQINGVSLVGNKTTSDLEISLDNNYTDAENKPQINGVTLIGNKTTEQLNIKIDYTSLTSKPTINNKVINGNISTSNLGIQYADLIGTPSIPSITNNYSSSDESAAITGKGVSEALKNYVQTTRTVTGTGALNGGGSLANNVQITHKLAPTGLTAVAAKVGVDSYGHVQLGGGISASDVNAQPATAGLSTMPSAINGLNNIVHVMCIEGGTFGFDAYPPQGQLLTVYFINILGEDITITIPATIGIYSVFYRGKRLEDNTSITLSNDSDVKYTVSCLSYSENNYMFID